MALEKETSPYELLIRFHEDGSVGALYRTITKIRDGNELLSAVVDPPEEMTLEEVRSVISGDLVERAAT